MRSLAPSEEEKDESADKDRTDYDSINKDAEVAHTCQNNCSGMILTARRASVNRCKRPVTLKMLCRFSRVFVVFRYRFNSHTQSHPYLHQNDVGPRQSPESGDREFVRNPNPADTAECKHQDRTGRSCRAVG